MSDIQTLKVQKREGCGKGPARRARVAGLVPAIIYGAGGDPLPVTLEEKNLTKILKQDGFLATQFNIELDGKKHHVLPRGIQFHPVNDRPIHVDFMRVSDKTRIRVMVRVVFLNDDICIGLKRGGVLNVVRHEIELICVVAQIPDHLEVDLAEFDIGDTAHISHVTLPEGVVPVIDGRDFTIATVAAPTVATDIEPGAEDEEDTETDESIEAEKDAAAD